MTNGKIPPALIKGTDRQRRLIGTPPNQLTDGELRELLTLGADMVAIDVQIIPVGPETALWKSWWFEWEARILERQSKHTLWIAVFTAVAALATLVTAIITFVKHG